MQADLDLPLVHEPPDHGGGHRLAGEGSPRKVQTGGPGQVDL